MFNYKQRYSKQYSDNYENIFDFKRSCVICRFYYAGDNSKCLDCRNYSYFKNVKKEDNNGKPNK